MPRVFVVGSSNTDLIVKAPRLPRPGETILGGRFLSAAGGKGANQAVAAARAGAGVTFIARLGCDANGDAAFAGFLQEGIATDLIVRDAKAPSGVALIGVSEQGENQILVAPGANARLAARDLSPLRTQVRREDVVVAQLEVPLATVKAAAAIARRAGAIFILNPAPAQELEDSLLKQVDLLTPNEHEAELLTGMTIRSGASVRRAAQELLRRGTRQVILTRGSAGAWVETAAGGWQARPFSVQAVDTTAAGDVFTGALAAALAEQLEMSTAVLRASAAAAISVTRPGAQPSIPRRREILAFCARHSPST